MPVSGETTAKKRPAVDPMPLAEDPSRAHLVEFLERITDELEQGPLNLPCFPDIVPRVRKALDDPDTTADDLVRVAGTEPRLAARLLQTANSAVFNRGATKVTNLRQAVTRLGHELVQSVTMTFAVQQMKADASLRPVAAPLDRLWQRSLAVASICRLLARRLGVPPDKVFLAGLLHGIGYFYIMVRAATARPMVAYDQTVAEFAADWHPSLGQGVLEAWGFEPVICEAVARQNDTDYESLRGADLLDVLIVSVRLAELLQTDPLDQDLSGIEQIRSFAKLKLSREDAQAILWHTENALESVKDSLGC